MGETNLTELFYGRHSRKCCVHISLFNLTQQWSTVNISISQMSTVRHEETRYFSKLVSGRVGTQTPRWHGPAGHVLLRCRSELASVMRLVIADSWLGASRTWTSPALGAPRKSRVVTWFEPRVCCWFSSNTWQYHLNLTHSFHLSYILLISIAKKSRLLRKIKYEQLRTESKFSE